ncbi:hypothetical protein [Piscinibacter gummiphilus]|jgi:hypothetical protein|uniref:hypothetical protein n=1 Tax=Piscinibacter gummiphilus TaxID=946333 RepID=UPI0012F4EDAF|nr:hypothetical protein [Piscinibacter gummiphilus]GLS94931.1 hypothetical protein GCM10007918_22230 [Piscinibacter gummiphilus]
MDAHNTPAPLPSPDGNATRWAALLAEMSELHAKLEYMRLMLRLQAGDSASGR